MAKQNLSEGSKSYHSEARIYERFSQVEDIPSRVLEFLESVIKGNVLDLGCGTGKYLVLLAPLSKVYYGLDISVDQLEIAKKKAKGLSNVKFVCSSAEDTGLPSESIDNIISTWVIGTVYSEARRQKILDEADRILKHKGSMYLVENDIGGDFEYIRNRFPDISRTRAYNDWLESNGFVPAARFSTYFKFDSLEEAKLIFCSIWGQDAAKRVNGKKIEHKIVIYQRAKIKT